MADVRSYLVVLGAFLTGALTACAGSDEVEDVDADVVDTGGDVGTTDTAGGDGTGDDVGSDTGNDNGPNDTGVDEGAGDTGGDQVDTGVDPLVLDFVIPVDAATDVALGGVRLRIGAGAVEVETAARIELLTEPPRTPPNGEAIVSPIVRLTPHGLTFSAAAELILPVESEGTGPFVHLRMADDDAPAWDSLDSYELVGTEITVPITGFSVHTMGDANCTSDCSDRNCGLDPVCGRSCGTCDFGEVCSAEGVCGVSDCEPYCEDAVCGFDGCGSLCGFCPFGSPQVCGSGQCYASYGVLDQPCANQPFGTVHPMVGSCAERVSRSAFNAPAAPWEVEWTWAPPGALDFSTRALFAPVLDGTGTLYVSSPDGVWAVTRGRTLWQFNATGTDLLGPVSPPAVAATRVYFLTLDGELVALDSATGALVWTRTISPDLEWPAVLDQSPIVLEGLVVVQTHDAIVAYDADGTEQSRLAINDGRFRTPLTGGRGIWFTRGTTNNEAIALDGITGETLWTQYSLAGSQPGATFSPAGELVYFELGDIFGNTTRQVWRDPTSGDLIRQRDTVIWPNIAVTQDGRALITSGMLTNPTHEIVDLTTGERVISFSTALGIETNPIVSDGPTSWIAVDRGGKLMQIDYGGSYLTELQLPASPNIAADIGTARDPVIGPDGRIYVAFGAAGGRLHAIRTAVP